jgi:predicted nucleotidyltransferase
MIMSQHIEKCRRFLQVREEQRQALLDRRFERAWEDARAIIGLLVTKYRPRRIYQWGSLLDRCCFWERSDIDIAVEGIVTPCELFAMYGEADRLASVPLDLVALEKIEPEFAEIIRTKGKLIYERECQGLDPLE